MRLEDAVLLGRGQPGVHRQHLGAGLNDASECVRRVVDLSFAAQEHEHIARALTSELLDGVADRLDLIAVVVARRPEGPVAQLDRVHTPGHLDDRRIVTVLREMAGEARCVDGRRRDDHLEVRSLGQESPEVPEDEVDVEAALVRLVDDQRVVAAQLPVPLQLGEQDAVGHDPQQRAGGDPIGEADGVPTPPPSGVPSSSATRSAIVRAATRRGCVWPTRPCTPRPSSRHIFGSWVLFPEPVSPATMTTWWSLMVARSSSRRAVIGSASG